MMRWIVLLVLTLFALGVVTYSLYTHRNELNFCVFEDYSVVWGMSCDEYYQQFEDGDYEWPPK